MNSLTRTYFIEKFVNNDVFGSITVALSILYGRGRGSLIHEDLLFEIPMVR